MDLIEHILYINLDHRYDRRKIIENTLSIFPSTKVTRISAIPHHPGFIGCTKSHIKALELAISNNWKNVLIVEDDIVQSNTFSTSIEKLRDKITNPYDVIVLAGTHLNYNPTTCRLQNSNTTAAYLVNQQYYGTLLSNFKEGLEKISYCLKFRNVRFGFGSTLANRENYLIDIWWHNLQVKDRWYFIELFVTTPSYSDIQYR
jgi:GR25 family glycosyltransferase involved in LPS biosynthesis